MVNPLAKLLSSPVSGLIDSVGGVLDKLITTDKDRLEAQRELIKIEREFQQSLMDADQKWAETQASVVRAEVASKSWMARNWRPLLMLTFTYIIAHSFVLVPLLGLPAVQIPPDMWDLLKLGMSGYIVGRSAEKIVPAAVGAMKGKQE